MWTGRAPTQILNPSSKSVLDKPYLFVTGGSGFIGSALVRKLVRASEYSVVNIDKLTYAGSDANLASVSDEESYIFVHGDINDSSLLDELFNKYGPSGVMHLAAESHVDKSISDPSAFLESNVRGTYNLLEASRKYWESSKAKNVENFRFHHVSTDEVFGALDKVSPAFTENSPYMPSSPYAASKAASDHLVRAWSRTYSLPTVISNCSNNYGPYQHQEKLIPSVITKALEGKRIPVYADGSQIRDWLFVDDHISALIKIYKFGVTGETYLVGGNCEMANIDLVRLICELLDRRAVTKPRGLYSFSELIEFVEDRPGHDWRYAVNTQKIREDLGWKSLVSLESGLEQTISWFIENSN